MLTIKKIFAQNFFVIVFFFIKIVTFFTLISVFFVAKSFFSKNDWFSWSKNCIFLKVQWKKKERQEMRIFESIFSAKVDFCRKKKWSFGKV